MQLNPYIRPRFNTSDIIMVDVIIALLPLVVIAWLAYGTTALCVLGTSVGVAIASDLLFSAVYLKNFRAVLDGSSIVTGLLLAFTISPLTPLPVVAFGAFSAILFGKIIWGGLGKNHFNPALVGREFMSVIFASAMTSPSIWQTASYVNITPGQLLETGSNFMDGYLGSMIYKTSGALGEYSIIFIAIGGLYLLIRRRISWHIPFALLTIFSLLFWIVDGSEQYKYSLTGVLFGAIFMATDMPSSPTTKEGKLYYGAMIGLVAFILIAAKVRYEYMSYSILILNGFSYIISIVLRPKVWGDKVDRKKKAEQLFLLTLSILGVTLAVLSLHYYGLIPYLIYIFIAYSIFRFNLSIVKKTSSQIL